MEIHITIPGRIPSKKNSKRQMPIPGRRFNNLVLSKEYLEWHKINKWKIWQKAKELEWKTIKKAKEIRIFFYMPDNRRADLSNKTESIMDLLVDSKVLADDSWQVTRTITLVPCGVDKENPRAEVWIYE